MSSQITHELRLRVATQRGENGSRHHEYLTIGQVIEEHFGQGNTREVLKLHATLLSPTLYAQIKPYLNGSAYAYIERHRLDRRAPNRSPQPPPPESEPTAPQTQTPADIDFGNAEVDVGGPLTHESTEARTRRSLH
jgi:hypothetical protein